MALQHLTEEQIRDWSREQKDRWWLEKVYRGNMPQLTLRSAVIGFLLGGVLSATNLYIGARTGWTLGVGLTSVILAFVAFRLFAKIGARDLTILENNCSQSIATAAGYMTGPLVSGFAAYMWVQNEVLPWWQMFWFNVVLSFMGVLVAFPMKRKFINDEQQPFPEGRACGVVLDTLYTSSAAVGVFKAKALGISAALAGGITFISGVNFMTYIQERLLGFAKAWHLPHNLDAWYYWMVSKGWAPVPRLSGVDIRQLGLSPALDFAMIGAGGLMGIRAATSMMIGMLINFVVIIPWMIAIDEIKPQTDLVTGAVKLTADGEPLFGRAWVLNSWALWWGIIIMVVASMVSLFAKPKVFVEAFNTIFNRKADSNQGKDVLKGIELPLWISWIGIPIFGAIGVWMAHAWFGVDWFLGALSIPLIIVLTLIAASSTALTGITPTGSLSKIPQFIFGAAAPKHPATNLMTAIMTTEVTSNASNLLMDIKPGYMLGGKPRHQAIGHCIGVFSGALAATPLFYLLFLSDRQEGQTVQQAMAPDGGQFAFPGAMQWKGVSDLITSIFGGPTTSSLLTGSIVTSMIIAAIVGLVFELWRVFSKGKFPISPLAIGLGVVVPPESTFAMFMGAGFFWLMHRKYHKKPESKGNMLWIQTHEPICAGLIAGAALVGIADILVKVFLLK